MSAAEESPILIPSEDEEEDGDEVQYIKEEKAPPITITDEADDQDDEADVIFVSTCPPPTPQLPTWDDALAAMDLDSFTLPATPSSSSSCSTDGMQMPGGSGSLSGSAFCTISALLDPSTPPSLPMTSNHMVTSDLSQAAKLTVPQVLGSDLSSLGASGNDLSLSDSSATSLTSALTSVASDLASMASDLSLPSVSGSLSGGLLPPPAGCPSSQGLGQLKTVLASDASSQQSVFSFHPTSSPLDLSQRDKACQLLRVRKKARHSAFSSSSPLLSCSSSSDDDNSSEDSDPPDNTTNARNSDNNNDNSDDDDDDMENTDDDVDDDDNEGISLELSGEEEEEEEEEEEMEEDNDDDDDDCDKLCLPLVSKKKAKSGVARVSISPPSPPSSSSTSSLSGWLDLALPSAPTCGQVKSGQMKNSGQVKNSGPTVGPQPSSSTPAPSSSSFSSSRMLHTGGSGDGTVGKGTPAQPLAGPPVIDPCRNSANHAHGAPSSSSSTMTSFSNNNPASFTRAQDWGYAQQSAPASAAAVVVPSTSPHALLAKQNSPQTLAFSLAMNHLLSSGMSSHGAGSLPPTVGAPASASQSVSSLVSQSVGQPLVSVGGGASSSSGGGGGLSLKSVPISVPGLFFSSHSSNSSSSSSRDMRVPTGLTAHPQQSSSIGGGSSSGGGGGGLLGAGSSSGRRRSCDFLDKLLSACDSIISPMSSSSVAISSTSVASAALGRGGASSSSARDPKASSSSSSGGSSSTGVADAFGLASGAAGGERGIKRGSTTSLSSLDTASLPPRKRVLRCPSPLLSHIPATSSSSSSSTPSCSSSSSSSSQPLFSRSSSHPAAAASTWSPAVSCGLSLTSRDVVSTASLLLQLRDRGEAGKDLVVTVACARCGKKEGVEVRLSQCSANHPACGDCLLRLARRVLSGKQKESLTCIEATCSSFYPINELKKSLPSIIVEILQERLDQDFVDFLDSLSHKDDAAASSQPNKTKVAVFKRPKACPGRPKTIPSSQTKLSRLLCLSDSCSSSDADDEDDEEEEGAAVGEDEGSGKRKAWKEAGDWTRDGGLEEEGVGGKRRGEDGQTPSDFPEHWTHMDNTKNLVEVVAVPLEPNSEEYVNVAVRFHENMVFPAADITRIVRIQNPYLWKSYSLKREQMIQENGGRVVSEHQLFHGTKVSTIDAICRRGFDWRFCGKHGTAFGQGCYFAGDSLYSNAYTDRGAVPASSAGSVILKSILQLPPPSRSPSFDPSSTTAAFPPHDPSSLTQALLTPQHPASRLRVPQAGCSGGGGLSGGMLGGGGPSMIPSSMVNVGHKAMVLKKLMPFLKSKNVEKHALIAQLLKARGGDKFRAIPGSYHPKMSSGGRSTVTVSSSSSISSSSGVLATYGPVGSGPSPAQGSLFGGVGGRALHPSPAGPPNCPPPPNLHLRSSSQSSILPPAPHRQAAAMYSHHRYTLLSAPHPHHHLPHPHAHPSSTPTPSFPPSQPPLLPHLSSVAPPLPHPSAAVVAAASPSGFRSLTKAVYSTLPSSKKYGGGGGRPPAFGSAGVGKVSALMANTSSASSSSSQGGGNGGGGLMVGGYPTNLSVSSTAVTLSGVSPSLALFTAANTTIQANSYLLVAPLPPPSVPTQSAINNPPGAPAPLPPPLAPLAPHPHSHHPHPHPASLLSQPPQPQGPPKGRLWSAAAASSSSSSSSSSATGGQALDLRKGGSCPRYMFLAKVLTGVFTGGQSDYRRPPPLDPGDPLGRCYDSCVDNIHTPRIWVVFDSTQAYPEYCIEYQVNGDMYR